MKNIHIYHIDRGYRALHVWSGNRRTGERGIRSRFIPNKELSRSAKYAEICRILKDEFGLPRPVYVPTKAEK